MNPGLFLHFHSQILPLPWNSVRLNCSTGSRNRPPLPWPVRPLNSNNPASMSSPFLGEPDFDTPEILKQAGIEAIEKTSRITPVPGSRMCVKPFARNQARQRVGFHARANRRLERCKAKHHERGVDLGRPRRRSDFASPLLGELRRHGGFCGRHIQGLTSIEHDFKIQPGELEAAINEKTRLLIYSPQPIRFCLHARTKSRRWRRF